LQIFHDQTEGWRIGAEIRQALFSRGEKLAGPLPEFIGYLKSTDLETRELGANLLERIGPKAKAAVPVLQEAVEGSDWGLASAAARALWSIHRQTNVALRVFTGGMQSTNSTRRQLCVIYLRQMGSAAKGAGPKIQTLLEDPDDVVRRDAERTLLEIDPSLLQSSLKKDFENPASRFFRLSASVALWRLGLEKDPPVISIVEQLKRQAGSDESAYVELLGEIGREAKPALPQLTRMVSPDRFIGLRRAAAIAIRKIDPAEAANLGLPGMLAVP